MKAICKSLPFAALILFFCRISAYSFEGPLQVRNLYPLVLSVDQHYLDKAAIEDSLSCSLSHSSTYTVKASKDWNINLDMEVTELNIIYRKIVKQWFEVDLFLPVLVLGGGFMDAPLEDYHDTFGFDDYGRSDRPHNEFLYEVRKEGNLVIKGKSGVDFGDIRIALKKPLLLSEDYGLSIKGDVEFPLSSAEKGYSNGSVDGAISLLFDKSYSDTTMTYWNLGAAFPGDLRAHERVKLKNYIYGGVAVESMIWADFSILVQLYGESQIYPDTSISAVDGNSFMIALGGRHYSRGRAIEFSLTEDLNTTSAPDFIINLTYKQLM